jgi:ABC-type proline/glycine betaine transport system ATPase subunit
MGMVFQDNSFFSGQTVYENTAYRLDDRGWPEDEIERAVIEVLTFVGLEKDQKKQAEDLSGGMKRRLELARALWSVGLRSCCLTSQWRGWTRSTRATRST